MAFKTKAIIVFLTILGSVLSFSAPTFAATEWDSVVQWRELTVGPSSNPTVISDDITGRLRACQADSNATPHLKATIQAWFDNIQREGGRWALTTLVSNTTGENIALFVMNAVVQGEAVTWGGNTYGNFVNNPTFGKSLQLGSQGLPFAGGTSIYMRGNANGNTTCDNGTSSGTSSVIAAPFTTHMSYYKIYPYLAYWNIDYPEGYEGSIVPETAGNAETIKPIYQWMGDKDGLLNIQYLKNIEPFLSGSSAIVINKMTTNWEELGAEVHNQWYQPAGWLNEDIQLPEPGYYMIRIDHNQALQSPPWQPPFPYIEQVWIQIRWDGENVIPVGNNIGDCGGICNDERNNTQANNKWWKLFNSLDAVNTHGLQQFLLAPITFFQTLPSKVENCSPITLPWVNGNSIELECMKDRYWAWSPTVMTIYSTVVNALVAYAVATRIFGHIKDMSTPQKDGIEVAKL